MLSEDQMDDFKITYRVLKYIMENDNMTKDTSFARVINYIANKICEQITKL